MTKQRESGVSQKLQDGLRRALPRSWWVKIHIDPAQPQALDIIGCWRGWFITIETKVDEGDLEPKQEALLPFLHRANAIVIIFHRQTDLRWSDQLTELVVDIREAVDRKERAIRAQDANR